MVELALSIIALILFGAGAFQFGYVFWARKELQSAVASGARYASHLEYAGSSDECEQRGFDAARRFVVYGNTASSEGAVPVLPGLQPSHVAVEVLRDAKGMPQYLTVSIRDYDLESVFSSYRLNGSPSATVPFQGRYAAHGCVQ
jgi:Flp pilus assembly protein TadG